jgi:putative membrane protein
MEILMRSKLVMPLAAALLAGGLWASSLGSDDTSFVKDAAKGNMTEVELGHLAVQKGASPDVKAFGQRMIRDHSKANRELATLASSKGVELPTSKSIGEDVSVAHLKMLSGKSFDEAYVKMMVDDHKGDVAAFEKASEGSQDPDVKHFATKTLPTLQSHLTEIEKMNSNMMSSK